MNARLLGVVAMLAAFSTRAAESDAPVVGVVVLAEPVLPAPAEKDKRDEYIARYILKLENENAGFKAAHVNPWVVVLIAVGAAALGASVTAGVYEAKKPKPAP